MKSSSLITAFIVGLYLYLVVAWIINVFQFVALDFQEPYKEEFVKAAGILIPPLSGITVWL